MRKFTRFLLFIFLHLTQAGLTQSVNINFTSLTTRDGLSSNAVNAILKDRYGVMWFGTEDGLDKFDGVNFKVYRQTPGDSGSLPANEILSLHEDASGILWVGTGGGSLARYDRKHDRFTTYRGNGSRGALSNNVIYSICSDQRGRIWVAHYKGVNILEPGSGKISSFAFSDKRFGSEPPTNVVFSDSRQQIWIGTNNGLVCFNAANNVQTSFQHAAADPLSLSNNHITSISEDARGNIWVGTIDGLNVMRPRTKNFEHINNLSSNEINTTAADGDSLWVGTGQGLNIMNLRTMQISALRFDLRNQQGINASAVRSMFIDGEGRYWLGTFRGGINKFDKNLNIFTHIRSNPFDQNGLNASTVTAFAEGSDGKVYIGTEGPGVSVFDSRTRLFKRIPPPPGTLRKTDRLSILALLMTKSQKLLIGTYADGLISYDPASGRSTMLAHAADEEPGTNDIFSLTEARDGTIWVGTNGAGISVLDPNFKLIKRYTRNPKNANEVLLPLNAYIRDIEEDMEGNFWIATHGGGLAVLEPQTGKFKEYNTDNSALPNNKIYTLAEDRHGNMWIGTKGSGLSVYSSSTKSFKTYTEKDGLQNPTVYKVIVDEHGLVWMSTNTSISCLDPATGRINNYTRYNGIQHNNFIHESGLRMSNGDLYFGGLDGFNYFNPSDIKKNQVAPAVMITDLRISNRSISPSPDGPIKENISVAQRIDLDYKQNFALSFVGLSYTSPEQNAYAYKLDGFDKDWNYIGNATSASYTNLDPGEYTFRVKASNNDGIWNSHEKTITIYVQPPFWRTIYAYLIYACIAIGSLFYIRYRGIQKLKRQFSLTQERLQREQEKKEAERVRELDMLKIKFLTNLSHEFKTPISLILGPTDQLLQEPGTERVNRHLQLIKRNARRLLNLVNQLLDFRKMEEDELHLRPAPGELIGFLRDVCASFEDLSERKRIGFEFVSSVERLQTWFDFDKLERILFNLLSNAFKFTLEGGKITLAIEQLHKDEAETQWLKLKIIDTGIGIPNEDREKIFQRFFQANAESSLLNQGTGIGLSITKEFVKLHGGTIDVESEPGKGSTFSITLPFQVAPELAPFHEATEAETQDSKANADESAGDLPCLLLVEDNEDFRFYLKDNLRQHYRVIEAANGKEGWQRALATHPQLVVSDISMPEMDGIELCRKIKGDKRTTHIPVILLTAHNHQQQELRGLETGANDYITKPFNFEVLNAKIKNLLILNNALRSTYSRQIKVINADVDLESEDEKLLQTIAVYLEQNLTNSQLSVEELSRHVGMSRSSLYSKLLELTGQTPVEYIRSMKLEKAAILLERSDMNIAHIAYSVGFATPNYFAKSFKAKYNMLPSDYINKMRKKNNRRD